jgi:hypothetical protein
MRQLRTWAMVCALNGSVAVAALAEDHQPFYLMGGVNYLNQDARELTTDRGIHAGMGYVSGTYGLIGNPGVDIDWRHAAEHGSRIDSISTCYSERAYIDSLYIGYGIGSAYNRIEIADPAGRHKASEWRPMLKAMAGYHIGLGVLAEGAWYFTGSTAGVDTSGFTVSIGVWF